MISTYVILLVISITEAQINGEFWWLNSKLSRLKNVQPPPPKYEYLSEFDTDESDKIIFRDNALYCNSEMKAVTDKGKIVNKQKAKVEFDKNSKIFWPDEFDRLIKETVKKESGENNNSSKNQDVFEFVFPNDDLKKTASDIDKNSNMLTRNKSNLYNDKITHVAEKQQVTTQFENICKYMKKGQCDSRKGFIYTQFESLNYNKTTEDADNKLICCVIPLRESKSSNIYFPGVTSSKNRFKRANVQVVNPEMKQRNVLLYRKHSQQAVKTTSTAYPIVTHKIITPSDDEYIDPYWNIKNSNFKGQSNPYQETNTKYDDYVDDYAVELPKPGLVGLYSDHEQKPFSWTLQGEETSPYGESIDSVEDDESFGYSTVDPRKTSKPTRRRTSLKLTTDDYEDSFGTESYTVSYKSEPDFKVLEGFKLILRNKSNKFTRNARKTTTDSTIEESKESATSSDISTETKELVNDDENIYGECGKSLKNPFRIYETDKQVGEADDEAHPWLGLAVLTKRPHNILCYATIIHFRVAITSADCVYGTALGDVTLVTEIRNLKDDRKRSQQRVVTVYTHSQYKPGFLAHNLAILHWLRPLVSSANVQPACLGDPYVGDDCMFFGWSGNDQVARTRAHWQRASVLAPRECNARLSSRKRRVTLPADAFCASVNSKEAVIGIGGPLICNSGNRHVAVGVAAWRDNVVVLLPAHEWAIQAMRDLHIA